LLCLRGRASRLNRKGWRSIGAQYTFGNRLANSAAPIVAATATVTVGNDCGKAGLMTIADRVALLFFAAVFSVAVGASIDGGLRSPYAANVSH
jgi:hypothetical protein